MECAARALLDLRGRPRDSDGQSCRRDRQHNPQNQVDQKTGAGEEDGQEPGDTNQRGIEIEIIGEAGTHTADFLVPAGAHETLGWDDAGWSSRAGRIGLSCATITAEPGTWGDFLLTR